MTRTPEIGSEALEIKLEDSLNEGQDVIIENKGERFSDENGSIVDRKLGSTVYRQTIGDPMPENA